MRETRGEEKPEADIGRARSRGDGSGAEGAGWTGSAVARGVARIARLRKSVRERCEDRPGVYRMVGEDGACLYVGKSVRVRTRLLSYFRAPPGEKAADLIRATRALTWEYVPDEFGALVRELRLIKKWSPPYNVEHTRRPRYAFLKITSEPAPRILATDRVARDGAVYFGPFPRPALLAGIVRELAHVAGVRDCSGSVPIHFGDQLEIFSRGRAPRCLRADTGSCPAPCAGRCTEEEYRLRVDRARRFLEGRSRALFGELGSKMEEAARRLDFEYAGMLRDRIDRLSAFQQRLVAFRGRVEDLTLLYRVPGFRGNDRLYLLRRGLVLDDLRYPKGRKERRSIASKVRTAFRISTSDDVAGPAKRKGPGGDPAAVTPQQAAEMLLVARWFQRHPNEESRTWAPDEWLRERGVD